jgi:hypothetical protein
LNVANLLEGIRSRFRRLTSQGTFRGTLGVAGTLAVGAGLVAVGAPMLGFSVPAGLAAAKIGELITCGLTSMVTALTLSKDKQPTALEVVPPAVPRDVVTLEVERMRDRWRNRALDAGVALIAYIAIAIPLGFLVLEIASNLPVSAALIVACYAYVGLVKFVGLNEFSLLAQSSPELARDDATIATETPRQIESAESPDDAVAQAADEEYET